MFNNLPQIIESFKGLGGFRFYFLSITIALIILIHLFKDTIVEFTKPKEEIVEHRRIRDLSGLDVFLKTIYNESKHNNYLVFLYQPKLNAIVKTLELIKDVHSIADPSRVNNVQLNTQPSLNRLFKRGKSTVVLVSKETAEPDLEYLTHLGLDYVLVIELEYYNTSLEDYKTIGEIYFSFIEKPSQEDIDEIVNKLLTVTNRYIL